MNTLSSDESAQTSSAGLNPLAIAVFAVALLIGGLLVWLSFAGNNAPPTQIVVALPEAENNTSETLMGDASTPAPQVLDAMSGQPTNDEAATADTSANADTDAGTGTDFGRDVQKIGSLPMIAPGAPLAAAPIAGLYEETAAGLLPVISADGARPVASYARPFAPVPADTAEAARPRIAIMITGFGLNRTFAGRALEQLPADVSLAFTPYSTDLQEQINAARADGHEVALELPMEPFDYPDNDPGPYTLLTSLPEEANQKRLEWLLARATGYFATVNRQGGRYLSDEDALRPILSTLQARGLGFIDTGDGARNATATAAPDDRFEWVAAGQVVDAAKSPRQIDRALASLEATARDTGMAVGIGTALPITVERVAEWAAGLDEKGIDLVPVSAALVRPQG